jgi:uncharacterized cupredoxin-like copper-binding protein
MSSRSLGLTGVVLTVSGALLIGAGSLFAASPTTGPIGPFGGNGMMGGGYGGMMGRGYGGMMGGGSWDAGLTSPGPGETGFVAGTPDAPRVVRILATPDLRFSPDTVRVQAGETIRFDVTTMGPVTHEFMVGPAADVAADKDGTPEIADLTMMQTASITSTFSGAGPFAFACHAPGHYEAGMAGTIVIVN